MGLARDMRLLADKNKIEQFCLANNFLRIINTKGEPPSEYELNFALPGYLNMEGKTSPEHHVLLLIPEKYPFSSPPKFIFLSGLFHPNVYRNGDVCTGWHLTNWNVGINIIDMLVIICKMIVFTTDSYNLKSPANSFCNKEWIATHQIPLQNLLINLNTLALDTNNVTAVTQPPIKILLNQSRNIKINA